MPLRRVFVDAASGGRAWVEGARAHHLARVVRLRPGEAVEVSDFSSAWRAVVDVCTPHRVEFVLSGEVPPEPPLPRLELYLALIKLPRFEWAIEKAAEVGAAVIVPVVAELSDRTLERAAAKRLDRWGRIAEEAARQARRLAPPAVLAPVPFDEALRRPAGLRLLLDFDAPPLAMPTNSIAESAALFAGPEGGWTAPERELALEAGARPALLGHHVLRAETAAIVGLAIVGNLLRAAEVTMGAQRRST